jgi:hypothetical protein
MARVVLAAMLFAGALPAIAQDNLHLSRLEQEVRQLQREVSMLSQLVNQLRAQMDRPAIPAQPPPLAPLPGTAGATPPPPAVAANTQWLNAQRWQRLRSGMSELEVIGELGPPTSMRGQDNERVLHYALEIGSSGFLAGSVTLRERAVVAIEKPMLR